MSGSLAENDHADGAVPLITVIITNYNYGRFLRKSIPSVLAQTCGQVECIVVDDGSTDGSADIIASYPGVRAIFQANQGQAQALRTGCKAARGKIVISLDADDFLYPEACAQIVAQWEDGASCLNYRLDLYQGEKATGGHYPSLEFLDTGHVQHLERFGYYPSAPMSGNAFAVDYARFILAEAEHLDGDGVDAYLLYSAPVFGKMLHIPAALGGYRLHDSNISMSCGKKTIKNLGDHIYYQYWAYENFQRFALAKGLIDKTIHKVRGPYLLLWFLIVQNGRYKRFELPKQGKREVFVDCVRSFLVYPDIGPVQRIKNIAVATALAFAPAPVVSRLMRALVAG